MCAVGVAQMVWFSFGRRWLLGVLQFEYRTLSFSFFLLFYFCRFLVRVRFLVNFRFLVSFCMNLQTKHEYQWPPSETCERVPSLGLSSECTGDIFHTVQQQRSGLKLKNCIAFHENTLISTHRRKIHNLDLLTNLVGHNPSVPTASSQVDVLASARSPNVRGTPFKRKSGLTYWLIDLFSPFLRLHKILHF